MDKAEIYTFDPESLRYKSVSQICDIVEGLIAIIRDQDQTIQLQSEIIESLEKD